MVRTQDSRPDGLKAPIVKEEIIKQRKEAYEKSIELAKQIVTMFSENKVTIRQAKTALREAEGMLADVAIHLPDCWRNE